MKNPGFFFILVWLGATVIAHADNQLRGLLLYEPYLTAKPLVVPFSTISWRSAIAGTVQVAGGGVFNFELSTLVRLIYLDEPYWEQINQDEALQIDRTEMLPIEVVLPLNRANMVSDADLAIVQLGQKNVAALLVEYPSIQYRNILLAVQSNLDRQVQFYSEGKRKVEARWLSPSDYAAYIRAQVPPPPTNVLLTTDGKRYENYHITSVDPAALHLIYAEGAATVLLSKLTPEEQARFHYDPDKAKAFLQSENDHQAAPSSTLAVVPTAGLDDGAKEELFLAQQPAEQAERYQKIFQLLQEQRVSLWVTRSQVTPNGVLALEFQTVNPGGGQSASAHPIFIVGKFSPALDDSPFKMEVYPAGNCGGQEYPDPTIARYVTNKLDYLLVMQINLSTPKGP